MITEKQYLEAQKSVDAWNSQLNQSRVMPRYFVDIRGGCGAVRDKWHKSYDEDYPGLHSDTPDVVEYTQKPILSQLEKSMLNIAKSLKLPTRICKWN